jgi:hypothetical protein
MVALSFIPVIFLVGKLFTRAGWDSFGAHPIMILYFIVYFAYAYFFWIRPWLIEEYLGINDIYQKLIYGAMCCVPFFEKDIPN